MLAPPGRANEVCAARDAPVHDGMEGRVVPIPVAGTRRGLLAGIVIGGMTNITRRWSGNDPCGSCGGTGCVVALLLRGSADPLSNGGGRGGRASRSACPRQRGA